MAQRITLDDVVSVESAAPAAISMDDVVSVEPPVQAAPAPSAPSALTAAQSKAFAAVTPEASVGPLVKPAARVPAQPIQPRQPMRGGVHEVMDAVGEYFSSLWNPVQATKQIASGVGTLMAPRAGAPGSATGAWVNAETPEFPGVHAEIPKETITAASDVIKGVFELAKPMVAYGAVQAPLQTANALLFTYLSSKFGQEAAKRLGMSPEAQDLAGDVAAVIGGTVGVDTIVTKMRQSAVALAKAAEHTGQAVALTAKLAQGAAEPLSGPGTAGYGTGVVPGLHVSQPFESSTVRANEGAPSASSLALEESIRQEGLRAEAASKERAANPQAPGQELPLRPTGVPATAPDVFRTAQEPPTAPDVFRPAPVPLQRRAAAPQPVAPAAAAIGTPSGPLTTSLTAPAPVAQTPGQPVPDTAGHVPGPPADVKTLLDILGGQQAAEPIHVSDVVSVESSSQAPVPQPPVETPALAVPQQHAPVLPEAVTPPVQTPVPVSDVVSVEKPAPGQTVPDNAGHVPQGSETPAGAPAPQVMTLRGRQWTFAQAPTQATHAAPQVAETGVPARGPGGPGKSPLSSTQEVPVERVPPRATSADIASLEARRDVLQGIVEAMGEQAKLRKPSAQATAALRARQQELASVERQLADLQVPAHAPGQSVPDNAGRVPQGSETTAGAAPQVDERKVVKVVGSSGPAGVPARGPGGPGKSPLSSTQEVPVERVPPRATAVGEPAQGVKSQQEETHGAHGAVPSSASGAATPLRPRGVRTPRSRVTPTPRSGGEPGHELRPSDRAGEPRTVSGTGGAESSDAEPGPERDPALGASFYHITDADEVGTGSTRERISRNLAAIRIAKTIDAEQRLATPDEQQVLVRYVGWGGLSRIFEPWKYDEGKKDNDLWVDANKTLVDLLTTDEFSRARNSTQNAHYTSPVVIRAIWDAVVRLGVTSGSVLEPSAGIGHFAGLVPSQLVKMSWAMVEKDPVTALIAKALYPGAFIQPVGFEAAALPADHFTLAISNVPFGSIPITDPSFAGPSFMLQRIHNYFFGKALDAVAPGGLIAFITTHGTLDSRGNQRVREYLASRADLVGAMRLPSTAFKANAGTDVVTDILFLRRRRAGESAHHAGPWLHTTAVDLPNKEGTPVEQYVNEYMLAHPEMVLGTPTSTGKMRAADAYNVEPSGDLAEQLAAAIKTLPAHVVDTSPPATTLAAFQQTQPPAGTRPFEYLLHEGRLAQIIDGQVTPLTLRTKDDVARITKLLPVRAALRALYDLLMTPDSADADVARAQKALGKAYDAFVKAHGFIASEKNYRAFDEDPDMPLLLSLEDYDDERGVATKTAIFTQRTIQAERLARRANSPEHALQLTLGERGQIDLDRIGDLLDKSAADAARALQSAGLILDTPSGWDLPARYLAGNIRVRLREAEAAAELDARYDGAVEALKAVMPETIPSHKINVRLGASWIPVPTVTEFLKHATSSSLDSWTVTYSPFDGKWSIDGPPTAYASSFTTPDVDTKTMLLAALNDKRLTIKNKVSTPDGGERTVVNKANTALARAKKDEIHKAFGEWLFNSDPDRRAWAVTAYNERFNAYVQPTINGSYLTFPGMSAYWRERMRPHQRDAVGRVLSMGNLLFAHVVGAGKTLAMVAAGMEMRRLGLARKPLYVVPNHLIAQWPSEFLQYYPNARLLVAKPEDLKKENRKRFTARIASGDWDAVVMPFSSFVLVSISPDAEMQYQRETLDAVETAIVQAWSTDAQQPSRRGGKQKTPPSVKNLEKMRDRIQSKLDKLAQRPKDEMLWFEQLGVDALLVDEAHAFKNLYFQTRQQAAGIPTDNDADRATDMYLKVRHINRLTNYRNVVLATGTPVSNSMAEIFVLQKMLQEQTLDRAGVNQFDAWLAQFGTITVKPEQDPSGTGLSARARLSDFRNLPDLAAMVRQVVDVKMIDDLPELKAARPKLRGDKVEVPVVPITARQLAYLADMKHRADNMDPRDKVTDNMGKLSMDGRLSALDMRLIDRRISDDPGSKINRVVQDVYDIWAEWNDRKGVQLLFLDSGVPGTEENAARLRDVKDPETGEKVGKRPPTEAEANRGLDLYKDMKTKLVDRGVPANQIVFITDLDQVAEKKRDAARKALFRRVRNGDIRILIGSRARMGTGMNVQDRLVALHNIDPAWKPSDIEQANGRILRQGNLFLKEDPKFRVRILNHVTSGVGQAFGYDAYMWGLNEKKAEQIAKFWSGNLSERDLSLDLEQTVLTASEMKAIATGNPLIMEEGKLAADVDRLDLVRQGWQESQREAAWSIEAERTALTNLQDDERRYQTMQAAITPRAESAPLTAEVDGHTLEGHKVIGEAILDAARAATTESVSSPGVWERWKRPQILGRFRGLTMRVEGNSTTEPYIVLRHPKDEPPRYGEATDSPYKRITVKLLVTDPEGPGGLSWREPTSLTRVIENQVDAIVEHKGSPAITMREQRIAQFERTMSAPFAQQREYQQAVAKLEEVRKALGIDMKGEEIDAGDGGDEEPDGTEQAMEIEPSQQEPGSRRVKRTGLSPQDVEFERDEDVQQALIEGETATLPSLRGAFDEVSQAKSGVMALWAPDTLPAGARAATVLRPEMAQLRHKTIVAAKAMRQLERAFDRLTEDEWTAFAVAVDEGHVATLPAWQQEVARLMKTINDQKLKTINSLGGRVPYTLNYYAREWVRPNAARKFIAGQLFRRRPLQGPAKFKKQRARHEDTGETFTFKELYDAGFRPVEGNPIRAHLRKWLEKDKWIMAKRTLLELKRQGLAEYVPTGKSLKRSGWIPYDDGFGTVWGPPVAGISEAYDAGLMEAIHTFAQDQGITMVRKMEMGKPNLQGHKTWGYVVKGKDAIHSRFGGPEGVLMHEIGHVLDNKYGLGKAIGLVMNGERAEEINFSETPSKVVQELRNLADLRTDKTSSAGFRQYVRKRSEVIANLVHAFLYVPDKAKEVAPSAYWALYNMAKDTPSLAGLLEIQKARSLRFASNTVAVDLGGPVLKGRYYGPRDAVRILNNHLSPGLRGNQAYDLYRRVGNVLNQVQLGLSGFHFVGTSLNSVISKQAIAIELASRGHILEAAKRQLEVPIAPLVDVIRAHTIVKGAYAQDPNWRSLTTDMDKIIGAGGGVNWDTFWHNSAPERFMQAMRATVAEAKAGHAVKASAHAGQTLLRLLPAIIEQQAKPIMQWWVPRLKVAAFMDLARMEMADLGPIPEPHETARVLGKAWDSVDNRFGELIYDNLFWNRIFKDVSMSLVRSMGWNLGTVREVLGAVPGQALHTWRQVAGGAGGGEPPTRLRNTGVTEGPDGEKVPVYERGPEPAITHKFAYFLSLLFWAAIFGALYQKLMTSLNPGEQEDGSTDTQTLLLDLYFPRTGGVTSDGRPERASLPTYMKDVYAFWKHPITTMQHKVHPILGLAGEVLWWNEDYFGNEIRDRSGPVEEQIRDVFDHLAKAYRPISVSSYFERQKNRSGGAIAGVQSFLGINVAPASVTRTAMEEYIHDTRPPLHRTKSEAAKADLRREIRDLVSKGDLDEARRVAAEAGLSTTQLKSLVHTTRQGYVQRAFMGLGLRQALHAYEIGTPQERGQVIGILRAKSVRDLPGLQVDERARLRDAYVDALKLDRSAPAAASPP